MEREHDAVRMVYHDARHKRFAQEDRPQRTPNDRLVKRRGIDDKRLLDVDNSGRLFFPHSSCTRPGARWADTDGRPSVARLAGADRIGREAGAQVARTDCAMKGCVSSRCKRRSST
jgi:hypothetical protein